MNLEVITEQVKEEELSIENIRLYGTGGLDVCGEWEWSGNYDMTLHRKHDPVDYNFYASIQRRTSKKGKTNGWFVSLYISLFSTNGMDIRLIKHTKFNSLKSAKQMILEKVQEIHADKIGTENLINKWKQNHAKPVFALNRATAEPILIGTTYNSAMSDMQHTTDHKEVQWFNDDFPDYTNHTTVYELNFSAYIKPYTFYLHKTEKTWGGYSGSSERDGELIKKMVEIVRNLDRYAWMFKKVEESKEEQHVN